VATHKSAVKAYRQSLKHRDNNRQMRTRLRRALSSIRTALDEKDVAKAKDALRDTISLVDRMASKGIIHKNAAARYKGRLTKRMGRASAAA
jgi:small subunit ribosomal protein S20